MREHFHFIEVKRCLTSTAKLRSGYNDCIRELSRYSWYVYMWSVGIMGSRKHTRKLWSKTPIFQLLMWKFYIVNWEKYAKKKKKRSRCTAYFIFSWNERQQVDRADVYRIVIIIIIIVLFSLYSQQYVDVFNYFIKHESTVFIINYR